jgi:hypothetical protein
MRNDPYRQWMSYWLRLCEPRQLVRVVSAVVCHVEDGDTEATVADGRRQGTQVVKRTRACVRGREGSLEDVVGGAAVLEDAPQPHRDF